jgi:Peptidase M15
LYQKLLYPPYIMANQHQIDWRNPDCFISKYFTVGEVTQNDPRRIPAPNSEEEINILTLAADLDLLREEWDGPIGITSWYRPADVNAEVGGARYSQHITGGAADVCPIGGDIYDFQEWVDERWGGGLGYGAPRGFVHLDLRDGGWERGAAEIRWSY